MNTVVTSENVGHMDELHALLRMLGVDRWRLLPIDTLDKRVRPSREQWLDLARKCSTTYVDLVDAFPLDPSCLVEPSFVRKGRYSGRFYGRHVCYAPWFHVVIKADGFVYPCCKGKRTMPSYGNVLRQDIREILRSSRRREICANMAAGNVYEACKGCVDFIKESLELEALFRKEE